MINYTQDFQTGYHSDSFNFETFNVKFIYNRYKADCNTGNFLRINQELHGGMCYDFGFALFEVFRRLFLLKIMLVTIHNFFDGVYLSIFF